MKLRLQGQIAYKIQYNYLVHYDTNLTVLKELPGRGIKHLSQDQGLFFPWNQ